MTRQKRPYAFYDTTIGLCSECLAKAEGKIIFQDGKVWMVKFCLNHGSQKILLSDDIDYFRLVRERFITQPEMPKRFHSPVRFGCPYDCGLCADHMQHSCLTLVELTDRCNLDCPICYAGSGTQRQTSRSLTQIKALLDQIVSHEGEPDVVQLSGGEPTLHSDLFQVLDYAKTLPIRHLMLNTNGLKIAQDPAFSQHLAEYMPGFELYLQFDGLCEEDYQTLRGANLLKLKMRAIEQLNKLNLSTTLVVTLKKGLNDDQCGAIIDFALQQPCVRGVTFQPIQSAGRTQNYQARENRLTLSEVRRRILQQQTHFGPQDLIPVPCNPDCLAMAYGLKKNNQLHPISKWVEPLDLVMRRPNSITFERDPELVNGLANLFSTGAGETRQVSTFQALLCCLPLVPKPASLKYENVFRVLIMQFLDADSFEVRTAKRSCVHIAAEDGQMVPFDTFNLFYREPEQRSYLSQMQNQLRPQVV